MTVEGKPAQTTAGRTARADPAGVQPRFAPRHNQLESLMGCFKGSERGDFRWGGTRQAHYSYRALRGPASMPSRRTKLGVARGYSFTKGVRNWGCSSPSFWDAACAVRT